MKELRGKTAIVTGGGRGIGKATALALAKKRIRVAVIGRTKTEIKEVGDKIKKLGSDAIFIATDVSKEHEVNEMIKKVMDNFGRIDILVNNAGRLIIAPVENTSIEDWNRTIQVNLTGTFLCSKAVLKIMMKQTGGKIINISSEAGKQGFVNESAYCAAKFGVIGFTQSMAAEIKKYNINVSVVCPGMVDTRMARENFPGIDRSKWLKPQDIAEVVLFLVSLDSRITIDEIIVRPTHFRLC